MQVALGPDRMGSKQPALMGVPGVTWLGGTISKNDSKHKGMQKPVADGRFKPRHKVRPSTHMRLPIGNPKMAGSLISTALSLFAFACEQNRSSFVQVLVV